MELLIILLIVVVVLVISGLGFVLRGRGTGSVLDVPTPQPVDTPDRHDDLDEAPEPDSTPEPESEPASFRKRLGKARSAMGGFLGSVRSRGVDDQTWDELEEALILADVGVSTATTVIEDVRAQAKEAAVTDAEVAISMVKDRLKSEVGGRDISLNSDAAPSIWLFVGVNGVGKTTTIGKLGSREVKAGKSVLMAAGDTFRAAAGEQLEMWADRANADIVRGGDGADPSSVIFDAIASAKAKGSDIVLADTAGRLQNKTNLMEELRKMRRVADKGAEEAGGSVTEVLLVIDATTGQNGLTQAKVFAEAVQVTGVVLTKLDGSAKGGIVMAIQSELDIPVKLVGLGEGAEDLIEFDADQFVEALFEA
ncbi:MAG: signal recognition particle-docking protein FtsY [Acidimicrobiales bacterium]